MNQISNSRRSFMRHAGLATALTLLPAREALAKAKSQPVKLKMPQTEVGQIPLPFDMNALDPVISAKTVEIHYGKHHKTYADKVQAAVKDGPLAGKSLEDVVATAWKDKENPALFNMSAQVWNHNFYWQSLSPKPQAPTGKLLSAIERDLGSLDACKKALGDACVAQFGSGWGWLVLDGGKLKIVSTSNADTPFLHGQLPLLTVDVWEHAYYLDYENRRADHIQAVLDNIINWDVVASRLKA